LQDVGCGFAKSLPRIANQLQNKIAALDAWLVLTAPRRGEPLVARLTLKVGTVLHFLRFCLRRLQSIQRVIHNLMHINGHAICTSYS
jgi:hypothetical protein